MVVVLCGGKEEVFGEMRSGRGTPLIVDISNH